jgi:hypothetical protein
MEGLTELRYLLLDADVMLGRREDSLPMLEKLVLLRCMGDDSARSLLPALAGTTLAVLSLGFVHCLPTFIGSFPKL